MKYLSCLAAIGLVESKMTFIIDDQKIVDTANEVANAIETEASRPEAQAVVEALQGEIEKAAIKVDLSLNKLVTPILERATEELEVFSFGEECKVHKFYQCLVDEGIETNGAWFAANSDCAETFDCHIEANEDDFDWDAYMEENDEF